MGKIILLVFFGGLAYLMLTFGLCYNVIGRTNPFHKFPIHIDGYDGSKMIEIKSDDDKYFFFLLLLFWPLLVLFYWIPIGLYKVGKFLINFLAWCIVKIFKL